MAQNAAENRTTQHIRAMARSGALPHALIISGSGDRLAAARFAAAAMQCRADADKPCCQCTQCRKVLQDIHPDVLWVEDTEHKELQVDAARELRQEMFIRPNDDGRKVAIFPNSLQLNDKNQNVLLKIVEEGPSYASFIFCAENSGTLLPTIRSRCVELKLQQQGETQADMELLRSFAAPKGTLTQYCIALENRKYKREQLQALLQQAWPVCVEALAIKMGKQDIDPDLAEGARLLAKNRSTKQLTRLAELVKQYASDCQYNVGVGHVLGALAAEWENTL